MQQTDPLLISVDAQVRPNDARVRPREFRRILALTWPYRKKLAIGLLVTLLFAGFHTISIGGVFPVLKLLLEREGLNGWISRTVAADRLDLQLGLPSDGESVIVVGKGSAASKRAPGIEPGDVIADTHGRPIAELTADLATIASGSPFEIVVNPMRDPRAVTVTPGDTDRKIAMLRWALGLLPPHPDTDDGKLRVLISILVALVVIVMIANVFRYVGEVLISDAILHAMIGLRAQLYERTLHLPMSYFSGQPSADLVTRFVQDVQEIQRGMLTVFGKFVREPLRAIFIFTAALLIDWTVTLTMVVIAPAAIMIFLLVGRAVKNANRKLLQAYGTMIGALTASLQNLRVVKAYTAEDQERERLRQVDLGMFRQQLTLAKLRAFVTPAMETLGVLVGSLLTVWLASRVLNHELSMSTFATLGVMLSMLFDPLRKLSDVWVRVQRSTAGAERIFQVIDQPVESDLSEANVALAPLAKGIEYDNVTFAYPGAEAPALDGIRLTIAKGETLAIVGPNGSGKTTLVNMLPRFFDPNEGKILYDGMDIRKATLRSLRDQISLVSQEAVVFAGTPLENIVYGVADPDEARAIEAARRAFADEFIRNIPGGYRAALGERGTTLSGGQRQRLAIARAIFRDAPILIFDEATSQIDTESEQKIQAALREFSQDRTTLIIAHRMSTIQFANRIIVMDAGRIIDAGPHQELFERCTLYRTLCETQFVTEGA